MPIEYPTGKFLHVVVVSMVLKTKSIPRVCIFWPHATSEFVCTTMSLEMHFLIPSPSFSSCPCRYPFVSYDQLGCFTFSYNPAGSPWIPTRNIPATKYLAHRPVHPLTHWTLRLVFILSIVAQARVFLLHTSRTRLECTQIRLICSHERLCHCADIRDQPIEEIQRHGLAHDNTDDFGLLFGGWKRIVCNGLVQCKSV